MSRWSGWMRRWSATCALGAVAVAPGCAALGTLADTPYVVSVAKPHQ